MFNQSDNTRDGFMLDGCFAYQGYDWWWHSFTGYEEKTGEEKNFFIEFFTCNPAYGEAEPIYGRLPVNQQNGRKPSYLMVKAGCWGEDHMQLHRYFGWDDVEVSRDVPYQINAGDCYASEDHLYGTVALSEEEAADHPEYMSDAGSMSWDLKVNKDIAFNVGYGAGAPFRKMKAFEMYWHAEGMKSSYEGKVICNGRTYVVTPETSYGYADKNWGRNFTSPWVWLSSNDLTSMITGKRLTNSVFDIGGGRPKVFGIPLNRKLLSAFWYEGREYEYNFSKFWTNTKTKFFFHETEDAVYWHVTQENRTTVMDTKVKCLKKDMLFVNYEAPDGTKRHNRLWNGGNGIGVIRLYKIENEELKLIDKIRAEHIGCEYGEYDS